MKPFFSKVYLHISVISLVIVSWVGCTGQNRDSRVEEFKKSPMEIDFGFTSMKGDYSEFRKFLQRQKTESKRVEIAFLPWIIGEKVDSTKFDFRGLKKINDYTFINLSEVNDKNGFDNEIKLYADTILKAISIKLFAPNNILPKYKCSKEKIVSKGLDSTTDKLDNNFNCLQEFNSYARRYVGDFRSIVNNLQRTALHRFILINWLGGNDFGTPNFLIQRTGFGDEINPYSRNLSLAWVKNNLVILITLCTPKYGTFHPQDEDYFKNIEEYQSGRQYPIIRCLITSLDEAKKNTFINVSKFLTYNSPLSTLDSEDY